MNFAQSGSLSARELPQPNAEATDTEEADDANSTYDDNSQDRAGRATRRAHMTATTTQRRGVRAAAVRAQYARAVKRAEVAGLQVAGQGYRRSDGVSVWAVPSQRDPNHWHLVTLEPNIGFVCDCEAERNGRYCVHKALARQRYLLELDAIRKWEMDQSARAKQRRAEQLDHDLLEALRCENVLGDR